MGEFTPQQRSRVVGDLLQPLLQGLLLQRLIQFRPSAVRHPRVDRLLPVNGGLWALRMPILLGLLASIGIGRSSVTICRRILPVAPGLPGVILVLLLLALSLAQ